MSNPWLDRRPSPGETCVFPHGYHSSRGAFGDPVPHWKRDALLFDRVYVPTQPATGSDIPIQLTFGLAAVEREMAEWDIQMGQAIAQAYGTTAIFEATTGLSASDPDAVGHDRQLSQEYASVGIMAEWSFTNTGAFLRRFSDGEQAAYEGALNNIPLVHSDTASWDQILAFREDPEAVRKYRDLRLWLRSGLTASSGQHAADIIGQKIEDYRWSIRRHGFETTLSALKTLFDWKDTKLALAAAGFGAATGGPAWAALAGGLGVAFQVGAFLAERRLHHADTARGPNREVAILYDIQERFGLPSSPSDA